MGKDLDFELEDCLEEKAGKKKKLQKLERITAFELFHRSRIELDVILNVTKMASLEPEAVLRNENLNSEAVSKDLVLHANYERKSSISNQVIVMVLTGHAKAYWEKYFTSAFFSQLIQGVNSGEMIDDLKKLTIDVAPSQVVIHPQEDAVHISVEMPYEINLGMEFTPLSRAHVKLNAAHWFSCVYKRYEERKYLLSCLSDENSKAVLLIPENNHNVPLEITSNLKKLVILERAHFQNIPIDSDEDRCSMTINPMPVLRLKKALKDINFFEFHPHHHDRRIQDLVINLSNSNLIPINKLLALTNSVLYQTSTLANEKDTPFVIDCKILGIFKSVSEDKTSAILSDFSGSIETTLYPHIFERKQSSKDFREGTDGFFYLEVSIKFRSKSISYVLKNWTFSLEKIKEGLENWHKQREA